MLINAHDHQTSEVHVLDANDPKAAPRIIAPRATGHEYDVEHHGDRFIITTNSEGAEDFRIVEAPVADPGMANWSEIIPHRTGRLIIEVSVTQHHIVRLEREDGLPRIVVRRIADGAEHTIAFAEEAYSLGIAGGYEFDTANLRFTYSSMTTPAEIYDYDMATRTRAPAQTPGNPVRAQPRRLRHAPPLRTRARRRDACRSRCSTARRHRSTAPRPLLALRLRRLRHLDAGLVLHRRVCRSSIAASSMPSPMSAAARTRAIAGTRTASSRRRPTPSPTSSPPANMLVAEGLTPRGRIVANGGSAGGMLMGAVANMAPELFLGIIADVPFVDVLNTMLDKTCR